MKFRTEGLIIKEQNIGESDKLVHALTKSNGVVKAFVRGAKNIKNQKCAASSLLSYSMLTFHPGRDSYSIGDARSLHIFSKLRDIFQKSAHCAHNGRETVSAALRKPDEADPPDRGRKQDLQKYHAAKISEQFGR